MPIATPFSADVARLIALIATMVIAAWDINRASIAQKRAKIAKRYSDIAYLLLTIHTYDQQVCRLPAHLAIKLNDMFPNEIRAAHSAQARQDIEEMEALLCLILDTHPVLPDSIHALVSRYAAQRPEIFRGISF